MAKTDVSAAGAELNYTLIVAHPFGDFERGATITDQAQIAEILAGENATHVRKVSK